MSQRIRSCCAALLLLAVCACGESAPAEVSPSNLRAEDFPSLAVRSGGAGWVAFQSWFERQDRIEVVPLASMAGALRDGRQVLYRSATQLLGTAMAVDADDSLHLVWSEHVADGWALRGLSVPASEDRLALGTPSEVATWVPAAGRHALNPVLSADGERGLLLVWVELDGSQMRVMAAARRAGQAWSAPVAVSADGDSAWAPDLTATGPGHFAVVWDSASQGDYDIGLARVEVDPAGVPRVTSRHRVTDSGRFEAHASVAAHGERLYVAYDVGPEKWGQEGSTNRLEVALHESRRVEVVAIEGERVAPLSVSFSESLNEHLLDDVEQPRVHVDAGGNLVLFFRGLPLQTEYDDPTDAAFIERVSQQQGGRGYRAAVWYTYMTRFDGRQWSLMGRDRRVIETSAGRLDSPTSLAALPGGGVAWAAVGDGREQVDTLLVSGGGEPSAAELRARALWWWAPNSEHSTLVSAGKLRRGKARPPLPVGSWRELPPPRSFLPRPPAPRRVLADGRTARLAFGDLHRHTDISRCSMNWDGSVMDAIRYGRDVGGLSFLAVTDHFEHMTLYDWWRSLAWIDAYDAPGRMVNLRAYERASAGDGHRNIISADSDLPLVAYPGYYVESRDDAVASNAEELLAALTGHRALAIPHTPAGMFQGSDVVNDWDTHDPQLDRLVEVFQGYRGSSEAHKAPKAIPGAQPWQMVRPQFQRGLHFGLIASSDHQSSDGAFAGAWVTAVNRDEVFDALHARRTFASTVRVSLWMDWGGVPMGTAASAPPGPTPLRVEVDGLGHVIEKVDLISNGQVLAEREVNAPAVSLEFSLEVPTSGSSWAYVRAHFVGGELAWSSPVRLGDSQTSPDGLSGAEANHQHGSAHDFWRDMLRRQAQDAEGSSAEPTDG